MTQAENDEDGKDRKRIRKPLPKSKKLNNTQILNSKAGGAGGQAPVTVICPTPQQPGYTINTHAPYC